MSELLEELAKRSKNSFLSGSLFVQGVIPRAKTDEDIKKEEEARKAFPNYLLIVPEQQHVQAYFPSFLQAS